MAAGNLGLVESGNDEIYSFCCSPLDPSCEPYVPHVGSAFRGIVVSSRVKEWYQAKGASSLSNTVRAGSLVRLKASRAREQLRVAVLCR